MTSAGTPLEKNSGTYALVMHLAAPAAIGIGKLGRERFNAGYYIYIGSAFGPGGLAARLGRHLKQRKKSRWHIDYLRRFAEMREIWYTLHPEKVECRWARIIRQTRGAFIPCPGFGASDCLCRTHLFHFEKKPGFRTFSKKAGPPLQVIKLCPQGRRAQPELRLMDA